VDIIGHVSCYYSCVTLSTKHDNLHNFMTVTTVFKFLCVGHDVPSHLQSSIPFILANVELYVILMRTIIYVKHNKGKQIKN
jgi:hypothetical protein